MWNPYSEKPPLCRIPALNKAGPFSFSILHSALRFAPPPDRPFRGPRSRFCPSPLDLPIQHFHPSKNLPKIK